MYSRRRRTFLLIGISSAILTLGFLTAMLSRADALPDQKTIGGQFGTVRSEELIGIPLVPADFVQVNPPLGGLVADVVQTYSYIGKVAGFDPVAFIAPVHRPLGADKPVLLLVWGRENDPDGNVVVTAIDWNGNVLRQSSTYNDIDPDGNFSMLISFADIDIVPSQIQIEFPGEVQIARVDKAQFILSKQTALSCYDFDGDNRVTVIDIMTVAAEWGPCP